MTCTEVSEDKRESYRGSQVIFLRRHQSEQMRNNLAVKKANWNQRFTETVFIVDI